MTSTKEVSYKPPPPPPSQIKDQIPLELFYKRLESYLLSEEELRENGYPRPHPSNPMVSQIESKQSASRSLHPATPLSDAGGSQKELPFAFSACQPHF
eukprot:m.103810 g.103810  ORF g.103810 m.103810 type:complete len:98 (+) comp37192_c0_seq19:1018-1311(+)